jgi:tetrahydromethanopterin S-methyltransferase subunit F
MTTIILPVDFSAASTNAVRYASDMSCDQREKAEELLVERSRELMAGCSPAVKVQTAMSEMPVLRAVHQLIHDVDAAMVVIGVDGSSEAGFISEHVIGLARTRVLLLK